MTEQNDTRTRPLSPHEYEVVFWLNELCKETGGDATASDLFEHYYKHGRPSYQNWSGRKLAVVLRTLADRGLVLTSGDTDAKLPGKPRRRYWLSEKGLRWITP